MKRLLTAFVLVITFYFGAWAFQPMPLPPSFERDVMGVGPHALLRQRYLYEKELERQRQNFALKLQMLRYQQEQALLRTLHKMNNPKSNNP
jgi:hypothetical protein